MFLHNTVRHRKAESRAFAGRFGGEEGVVDAVDVLGGDAVPGVRNLHPDAGAFGPSPDFQDAAGAHPGARVEGEIQEDLLEFTRVPVDGREIGVEVRLDLDSGLLQLMFEKGERLLDDPIQADVAEGRGRRAREVQQGVDDLARAEGLLGDLVEYQGLLRVLGNLLGEHLRVGRDHRERRVHLVRHTRRQQANARQLVGLDQPLFELGAIGHIVENDETPDLLLVLRYQRRNRDVQRGFPQERGDFVDVAVPVDRRQGSGGMRLQHEFVDVVDSGLPDDAIELVDQLVREQVAQFTTKRVLALDPAELFDLGVPALDPVLQVHRQYTDINGFDDVLAELLQALVLFHLPLQGTVQRGVLDGDSDVSRQRDQQLDVDAREVVAVRGAADAH